MTNLLITGANGFIGRALGQNAVKRGFSVRCATRSDCQLIHEVEHVVVEAIDAKTAWSDALKGVDVVIHLAARVHVMNDKAADPLDEFRKVNVPGILQLARSAAAAGVKRFVYVCSIKVNGEETASREVYREADIPSPQDPYGVSKWEAEQALKQLAIETGLEVVIVRPPLVYGSGVKGNFVQMLSVLSKGIPLPLASVANQRDLIYVGNLVDALITCAIHPAAAGQTYLVSDGQDISTADLLSQLAVAMGKPARLFPFPPFLIKLAGRLVGKSDQVDRLLGSLRVNSSKIRRELNWTPPYTLQQGLQATAKHYLNVK